jgi:NADPH:quinone reductase-like Zn-dependent oxidoreductase
MKAAISTNYGPPSVLQVTQVAKAAYKDTEVLVRVYATTVNRTDTATLRANPFIMRFFTGLFRPTSPILGTDFAGKIVGIGKSVTGFKVGDKVFGFHDEGLASHAEYMAIGKDKAFMRMPKNISYQQAAASLEGAHYAYNFITKVKLKRGQKVLVNGATGAIGSAAVQFLTYFGLTVTATCNTKNIALVKSLGATRVIDYTKEDFTTYSEKYPFIFDAVGKSTFGKCKPILEDDGIYISSELGPNCENPFLALLTPVLGGKKVIFPIPVKIMRSLTFISKLIEEKRFKAVIDRTYPLEKIADAYAYVETGQKVGNVVIVIK